MPRFHIENAIEEAQVRKLERLSLDERFLVHFMPETPLDRVETDEFRQLLVCALQMLTPVELKVVEHRFQHKCSPAQIARALALPKDQVHKHLSNALEKLRQSLAAYWED